VTFLTSLSRVIPSLHHIEWILVVVLEIIRNHIPFQFHPGWSQNAHLGYWRRTIINWADDGIQCLTFRLLTVEEVWGFRGSTWPDDPSEVTTTWHHNQSNYPCQRSQSETCNWWHHSKTILARVSNQKQLPHDNSVIPTSLELWKVLWAPIWLHAMAERTAID
jgi:hypothetical protein